MLVTSDALFYTKNRSTKKKMINKSEVTVTGILCFIAYKPSIALYISVYNVKHFLTKPLFTQ